MLEIQYKGFTMLHKIATATIIASLLLMAEVSFVHATPTIIKTTDTVVYYAKRAKSVIDIRGQIRRGHRSKTKSV